ncbi:MAG: amidohydrolase family protein [Nitriliruptoraceae bacterium]
MTTPLPVSAPERTTGGHAPRGTLLVADRVVTLGHARTTAVALLVRGSRVVWVGDDPDLAPPHHDQIDLRGCVIGPGFVDAHAHMTTYGLAQAGLDVSGISRAADLLHAIGAYAAHHTGRVVWGHGLDGHGFVDEFPGPDEIAEVALGRAVFVAFADGHTSLVDRRTLASAPLARSDGVERDGHGAPTGLLRREANNIARRWSIGAIDDHQLTAARHSAADAAVACGIVSVHEMGGPDMMGLTDFDAWIAGCWPVEVIGYWGALDVEVALSRELRQVGGDLCLDGSFGAHTAALTAPYADVPGQAGMLELDDATLAAWLLEASLAGLQTSLHAVGDAALRQLIRCWRSVEEHLEQRASDGMIRRGRHRVEHAELLPIDVLDDLASLGIVVSTQPNSLGRWGRIGSMYSDRLGEERLQQLHPYRAITDHGVGLAFGGASNGGPLDPWRWIRSAEQHPSAKSRVSRLEAVSMSTLGGRHAARQERYVGVVRAGMRADLAVFEGDPYNDEDPTDARCVLTVVQGRVAHGEAPLPDAPGRTH